MSTSRAEDIRLPKLPVRVDPDAIVEYYTEAGADYAAWSTQWNMHFGFPVIATDVLDREQMLDNMNDAILDRVLAGPRPAEATTRLADLGCGLGATMRRGARRHLAVLFDGFTIVDWQVAETNRLNEAVPQTGQLAVFKVDYRDLPVADGTYDGAYAIESACYATGSSKRERIAEAARVVRPGGRLVVADGFRIDDGGPFSR